jgi:DNA-binding NtrC family response regulator
LKKQSLFVVDGELQLCGILVEYFSELDLHTASASDAKATRNAFERQVSDTTVLDIRMPGDPEFNLTI